MFEVIENNIETISPKALEHINSVFNRAKQLKKEKSALFEATRTASFSNRPVQGFQVKGLPENIEKYKDNLKTLEVDDLSYGGMLLSVIKNQKSALESRLADIASHKDRLDVEMQELNQAHPLLVEESESYIEKLASGDIAAAEEIENTRQAQLQENTRQKQAILDKTEGFKKAENLILDDISIYSELEKITDNCLLLLEYNLLAEPIYKQLEANKETYNRLSVISHKLWGDNYDRWGHICKLQDFISDGKNAALKRGFIGYIEARKELYEINPKFANRWK